MATLQAKETSSSPLRVLVLGGGYAGLAAGLNLLDLCQGKVARFNQTLEKHVDGKPQFPIKVKFVDERDGYYHVISSPLTLCDDDYAPKAWQRYADLPAFNTPEISFAQGTAIKVDAERKVASIKDGITGKEYDESYDYLISATGLRRSWPAVPQSLTKEKYLAETGKHIELVKNAKEGVVVVGGGAVGIEMAAEIAVVHPTQTVTLIHSRPKLLSAEPLPDDFKDLTVTLLEQTNVKVILGQRVISNEPTANTPDGSPSYTLTLSNGTTMKAGHVIFAISHQTPITSYLPKEALDEEGYVHVSASMEFSPLIPNHKFHYAIGDICHWSGIKRCGAAMSMGYHAACNIHQRLLQTLPQTHKSHLISHSTTPSSAADQATNTPTTMTDEPEFKLFPEVPPMIAIAIGKTAIMLSPMDGTTSGPAVLEMMFREDLGFAICWNYLQLGIDPALPPPLAIINEEDETPEIKNEKEEIEVKITATAARMEAITV